MNSPIIHIARSMRPKQFKDVIGQERWVKFIQSALSEGLMLPVCVICGPSGVGKTTIARLIAMWECCEQKCDNEPCGKCNNCVGILNDAHPDVVEFDAGTYTGVDDIKSILDSVNYKTILSKKRVYILDEVHMLSRNAVSSLLKLFESDLKDVQFILATTHPGKLPDTIISRSFRISLTSIPSLDICNYMNNLCNQIDIKADTESLTLIAKSSQGSMRQALATLEQCKIMQNNDIKKSDTEKVLGLIDDSLLIKIMNSLEDLDMSQIMTLVKDIQNPKAFIKQLLSAIRDSIRNGSASNNLIEIGYSLADSSVLMYKSPCENLLEIILGKVIIDRFNCRSSTETNSSRLTTMAKQLFNK